MYEAYTVLGQRGQITIPKEIRDKIKEKDRLLVKLKENNVTIQKVVSDKEINKLMIEGYKKLAKIDKEILDDFKHIDSESNNFLGDY